MDKEILTYLGNENHPNRDRTFVHGQKNCRVPFACCCRGLGCKRDWLIIWPRLTTTLSGMPNNSLGTIDVGLDDPYTVVWQWPPHIGNQRIGMFRPPLAPRCADGGIGMASNSFIFSKLLALIYLIPCIFLTK